MTRLYVTLECEPLQLLFSLLENLWVPLFHSAEVQDWLNAAIFCQLIVLILKKLSAKHEAENVHSHVCVL